MAPVTEPAAEVAIIAHGQPSDPARLQAEVEGLAAQVAHLLPGRIVHGATLAAAASLAPLDRVRIVYPLFMAEGWFTRTEMPRRLRAAGLRDFRLLRPLGLDPALPAIGVQLSRDAARQAGLVPAAVRLVVAAHGSQISAGSRNATRAFAAAIDAMGIFESVETAFLEEAPFLRDASGGAAVCLPFFATHGSHCRDDIPAEWAAAGAPGPIAGIIGRAEVIPALIAAALDRDRSQQAA